VIPTDSWSADATTSGVAGRPAPVFHTPVSRPRVLLVPDATELEWAIKPLLEEWAEVASFDAPGVGEEPPAGGPERRAIVERGLDDADRSDWKRCVLPDDEAIVERGIAEIERRGWDRCVVVGDEFGAFAAAGLAAARPACVEGLALGHACLSLEREGERAPVNAEVFAGFVQLARFDYRTFARTLSQVTQGAYDEELADRYIERVPQELTTASFEIADRYMDTLRLEPALRRLDVPLLLAQHRGCLLFTREGYEDAVAAFPDAARASFEDKPSASPEFAARLRQFCAALTGASRERA
jgi:pimeloyl-ACP methyl ester carboxylesterase